MFRFNPRSRCNRSSRCCYRAREHVFRVIRRLHAVSLVRNTQYDTCTYLCCCFIRDVRQASSCGPSGAAAVSAAAEIRSKDMEQSDSPFYKQYELDINKSIFFSCPENLSLRRLLLRTPDPICSKFPDVMCALGTQGMCLAPFEWHSRFGHKSTRKWPWHVFCSAVISSITIVKSLTWSLSVWLRIRRNMM